MMKAKDAQKPFSLTIIVSITCESKWPGYLTYGPRMYPNDGRVVSNFILQALRNDPITVFGDGSQSRSFCYVDDLMEGLIKLMNTLDDFIRPY